MSNLTDVLIRGLLHSWQLPPSPSLPEIPLCVCTQFLPHLFSILLACFHCCFTVTLYLPSSLYLHSSLSVPHHSAVISLTFLFISHSLSYSIDRYRSHTRTNLINSDNGSYFYRCIQTHLLMHTCIKITHTYPHTYLKVFQNPTISFLFCSLGGEDLKKSLVGISRLFITYILEVKLDKSDQLYMERTHTALSNQLLRDINFHSKYTLTKWLTNKCIFFSSFHPCEIMDAHSLVDTCKLACWHFSLHHHLT